MPKKCHVLFEWPLIAKSKYFNQNRIFKLNALKNWLASFNQRLNTVLFSNGSIGPKCYFCDKILEKCKTSFSWIKVFSARIEEAKKSKEKKEKMFFFSILFFE